MARLIEFECRDCAGFFTEPVQRFVDEPGDKVAAPMLCEACGHGGEDDDDIPGIEHVQGCRGGEACSCEDDD